MDKKIPLPEFVVNYILKKGGKLKKKSNLYEEERNKMNETEESLEKLCENETPHKIEESYQYFIDKIGSTSTFIQRELNQFKFPLFLHLAKCLNSHFFVKQCKSFIEKFRSLQKESEQATINEFMKKIDSFKIENKEIRISSYSHFILMKLFELKKLSLVSIIILNNIGFKVDDSLTEKHEDETTQESQTENHFISDVLQLTLYNHHKSISTMKISNNGKLFAYADNATAKVFYLGSGNYVFPNKEPSTDIIVHGGPITTLKFSDNSCVLASGGMDNEIRIAHTEAAQQIAHFKYHSMPILDVNFIPDSYFVIGASMDRTISLWSMKYPQMLRLFVGHTGAVQCTTFPRQNLFASGSIDGSLRIWDVSDAETICKIDVGKPIVSIDMHKDTSELVCGTDDGYVIAFDSKGSEMWRTKTDSLVSDVKITNDGRHVFFCTENGTLETWTMEGQKKSRAVNESIAFKTINVFEDDTAFVAGLSTRGE